MTQKELIKGFEKFESIAVDGQAFYVRHLRGFEISRIRDEQITIWGMVKDEKDDADKRDSNDLKEKTKIGDNLDYLKFALYCADEHGKRLFCDDEIKDISGVSRHIVRAVNERGDKLNPTFGVQVQEKIDAAKKDSGGEPMNTTGTSSPATSGSGTLTDSKKE